MRTLSAELSPVPTTCLRRLESSLNLPKSSQKRAKTFAGNDNGPPDTSRGTNWKLPSFEAPGSGIYSRQEVSVEIRI